MSTKKSKSALRFELLNFLVDHVLGHVSPAQGAMLFAMFRHAGPSGVFRLSPARLGGILDVSPSYARKLRDDLRERGIIEAGPPDGGWKPRRYRFTPEEFARANDVDQSWDHP